MLVKVQGVGLRREPAHEFLKALDLRVSQRKVRHAGDSLQLQTPAVVEGDGAELVGKHVLRAVDNDLQQAVKAQR